MRGWRNVKERTRMIKVSDILTEEQIEYYRKNPVEFLRDLVLSVKVSKEYLTEDNINAINHIMAGGNSVVPHGIDFMSHEVVIMCSLLKLLLYPFPKVLVVCSSNRHKRIMIKMIEELIGGGVFNGLLEFRDSLIYLKSDKSSNTMINFLPVFAEIEWYTGFCGDYMTTFITDACWISDEVINTLCNAMTGVNNEVHMISRAVRREGLFYKACQDNKWRKLTIPSLKLAEFIEDKYGKGSNIYKIDVLAEFPEEVE